MKIMGYRQLLDYKLEKLNDEIAWGQERKNVIKKKMQEKIISNHKKQGVFLNWEKLKNNKFKTIFYSLSIAVVAFGLFIGSGFISPAMANVVNKIPFINIDNHNVIQLQKNPAQIKAYLNLVSAFNKGNETAYQNAFSQTLSAETIKNNNEEFYVGVRENHQFSATLDLMYSYDKKAILLSREVHAFNSVVAYDLDSYIILNKVNEEWKVQEKIPFKKVGKGNLESKDDFDRTEEVKKQIKETYKINLNK
jgi:hypothetical protein